MKDKLYKSDTLSANEVRYNINRDATLDGISKATISIREKLFMYPSEICDVFLVPQAIPNAAYHSKAIKPPTKYDDMLDWWNPSANSQKDPLGTMCMTGDNLREEPLQSSLSAAHYQIEQLHRSLPGPATSEKPDRQAGGMGGRPGRDQRGHARIFALIERYVDPNDALLT